MTDHAEALAKALEPFSTYTPDRVFESKARFTLIETTEAGGGWFGAEDFRAVRSALAAYRSRPAAEVVELRERINAFLAKPFRLPVGPLLDEAKNLLRSALATPALAGTEPAGEVVEWQPSASAPREDGVIIEIQIRETPQKWNAARFRDVHDGDPRDFVWRYPAALRDQSEA